jgi:hypothetical protein
MSKDMYRVSWRMKAAGHLVHFSGPILDVERGLTRRHMLDKR